MTLPPALAQWAAELNVFPDDIGAALGPMILRLSSALGPFASPAVHGQGEPDGYSDLGVRGNYDRLVPSEWLLAEELPEEFDRRAAMNEHLFWQFARKEPAVAHSSYVLFDAGPSQVGSPRLAHIALLIVMIRRARAARATFGWGILQDKERRLLPGLSESEFWTLLGGRSGYEPSSEDCQAWEEKLSGQLQAEEVWLAGGTRAALAAPARWRAITINEPFEIQRRELDLSIRTQQFRRDVLLELPSEPISLRLLRDPFQQKAKAVPKLEDARLKVDGIVPASNLVFDHLGNNLFARSEFGDLIVYVLENIHRDRSERVKRYSMKGDTLLSVGKQGHLLLAAALQPEGFSVRVLEGAKPAEPQFYSGRYSPPIVEQRLLALVPGNVRHELTFLTSDSRRFQLGVRNPLSKQPVPYAGCWEQHVLAVALLEGRNSVLRHVAGGSTTFTIFGRRKLTFTTTLKSPPVKGFISWCDFGYAAACGDAEGLWTILHIGRYQATTIESHGHNVVGVTGDSKSQSIKLLVLEKDQQTISMLDNNGLEPLLSASAPIAEFTASYRRPYLAYCTLIGDVSVYSFKEKRNVAQFMAKGRR